MSVETVGSATDLQVYVHVSMDLLEKIVMFSMQSPD